MSKTQSRQKVLDEEGDVDKRTKRWIRNNRERVDDTREQLFIESKTHPQIDLSEAELTQIWASSVETFLVSIEPLLRSNKVKDADKYYKEVPIGKQELVPPDVGRYQFSMVARRDHDEDTLRRMLDLPRDAEIPTPVTHSFEGLKSVIEAPEILQYQWEVAVDTTGAPPEWEYVYPQAVSVVSKDIYRDALREADEFLQEANLGIEIGMPEVDDEAEAW